MMRAESKQMKLSMGTWSFAFGPYAANPKSIPEIARRLAAAGFDGIELSGYPPHVTPEAYATPAARAELKALLSDLGLGISGYSSDLGSANPTIPENRTAYLDLFRRLLDLCHDLGSPMIRVDSVGAPGSIPDEDYHTAFHRLADLWRDCADAARQAHVLMAWEFEPGFLFNKPSEVIEMHELVGHPWFQILFDTAHAYMCGVVGSRQHGKREILEGGVAEFIAKLHGSIGAVHVIDSDGTLVNDDTSTHLPIGEGHVPWPFLAPKLLNIPHIGWWCADLCFYEGAWERIDDNLRAVRGLLAPAPVKR
ncbi:sugar phosphate isomerase/epimerase family protein [Paludibaculum fermentans]|uniref:Sugar phosphate isomerase/epimerase n=1 Tax=Paludibaculum fermentans TaxID=1473598 RepID=A0A7S7NMZ2_PALFE|nr:sugar phosphate isomerase/epimerase family protein [Paludibaculum fermentans]QOY86597.1 sugar phosphate isomerase/epimerase [Paludibaculum fermentans]